jgi:hypothetical protein
MTPTRGQTRWCVAAAWPAVRSVTASTRPRSKKLHPTCGWLRAPRSGCREPREAPRRTLENPARFARPYSGMYSTVTSTVKCGDVAV